MARCCFLRAAQGLQVAKRCLRLLRWARLHKMETAWVTLLLQTAMRRLRRKSLVRLLLRT